MVRSTRRRPRYRRIALPMLGGMIFTTILTLIVIPVIYYVWEGRRFRQAEAARPIASEKPAHP